MTLPHKSKLVPRVPSRGKKISTCGRRKPRVLLVTPEISESSYLSRNGTIAPCVKAGGLADVCALLVDSLAESGADMHVALPDYQQLFQRGSAGYSQHLHLCKDREFAYRQSVYEGCHHDNLRAALAFQRDVIQYIIPRVKPDLIHCHDWITGMIPAAAKSLGIPSVFTVHNLHDQKTSLEHVEDRGIDAARFWDRLYYQDYPGSYESTRSHNPVSTLASGIFAADQMNTVSRSFLHELASGCHDAEWQIVDAVRSKMSCGRAHGIINSLSATICPERDIHLECHYDAQNHVTGKQENKRILQRLLGLEENEKAPILFWPSRFDPVQKGCQLLAEILHQLVSDHWALGLQVVFIADGPSREQFENIISDHGLQKRIAIHEFSESVSRLGYAGSDFTLMPSAYEPCGLSQMIGLRYGSLPIVHATGGLRDTVEPLDRNLQVGNGFAFEHHDAIGLRWAIDEAMHFHSQSATRKEACIARIMTESTELFSLDSMVNQYLGIYKGILAEGGKNVHTHSRPKFSRS